MSTTIGGLTIPTGWISANDDNFIEWKGLIYTGTSVSNVGGKLAITFSNPNNYTGFEMAGSLRLYTSFPLLTGTYKILSGSGSSGTYTVVLDVPFAPLTGVYTIAFLWDINIELSGFNTGINDSYVATCRLILNQSEGVGYVNMREFTRHFFPSPKPFTPMYNSVWALIYAAPYDTTLYRHIRITPYASGSLLQWLTLNLTNLDTVLGYNPSAHIVYCLNSGFTNTQIQAFTTGNRPIADHNPFDDCNERNLHSYIVGNEVITLRFGILNAGVDFDKIDIDLIAY